MTSLKNAAAASTPVANDNNDQLDSANWGPSYTEWQDPQLINPLLKGGDSAERERAERLMLAKWELFGYMDHAVRREDVAQAVSDVRSAKTLAKVFLALAKNLAASHSDGTQSVVKIITSGPTVGLQAKIDSILKPSANSPTACLVGKVQQVVETFSDSAERFLKRADQTEDGVAYCRENMAERAPWQYVPTYEDARRWRDLATEALAMAALVDKVLLQLQRDRCQVMTIKDPRVPKGAESTPPAKPARHRRDLN